MSFNRRKSREANKVLFYQNKVNYHLSPNQGIVPEFDEAPASPVGSIVSYVMPSPPRGWLNCDGAEINLHIYRDLYNVIGTTFGTTSSPHLTFKLPDLRGRIPLGNGLGAGLTDRVLGNASGHERHTLTVAEMPSHNHTGNTDASGSHNHGITDPTHNHGINDPQHNHGITDPTHGHGITDLGHGHGISETLNFNGVNTAANGLDSTGDEANLYSNQPGSTVSNTTGITINNATTGITINNAGTGISMNSVGTGITINSAGDHQHGIQSQGGGNSHNNMQPFLVVNYIIRYAANSTYATYGPKSL